MLHSALDCGERWARAPVVEERAPILAALSAASLLLRAAMPSRRSWHRRITGASTARDPRTEPSSRSRSCSSPAFPARSRSTRSSARRRPSRRCTTRASLVTSTASPKARASICACTSRPSSSKASRFRRGSAAGRFPRRSCATSPDRCCGCSCTCTSSGCCTGTSSRTTSSSGRAARSSSSTSEAPGSSPERTPTARRWSAHSATCRRSSSAARWTRPATFTRWERRCSMPPRGSRPPSFSRAT